MRRRRGYNLMELISTLGIMAVVSVALIWSVGQFNDKATVESATTTLTKLGQLVQADAIRGGGVQITMSSVTTTLESMDGNAWSLAGGGDGSSSDEEGEISVYIRGGTAGLATLVGTSCVLVRIPIDGTVRAWSWDDIGGWCRGRTAVDKNPDGTAPSYLDPNIEPEYGATGSIAAPSALVATVAGDTVRLSWTAPAGSSSFDVRRGPDANSQVTIATVETSFYENSPVADGSYVYSVIARTTTTSSAPSAAVSVTVGTNAAPSAPYSLAVGALTPDTVNVTWSYSGADPDAFTISVNGRGRLEVGGNVRGASVPGLSAGESVVIGVKARVGAAYSSEVTVTSGASIAPQAPTNLRWTVSGSDVRLAWDGPGPASAPVSGYRVLVDGVAVTTSAVTTTTLTSLTPGSSHRVEIVAYGPGGDSQPSRSITVTAPQ